MSIAFLIIQCIIALLLVALILMQTSKGGLQTQVGGSDVYRTKRGAEKLVFRLTIIMASLFFIVTVLNAFIG